MALYNDNDPITDFLEEIIKADSLMEGFLCDIPMVQRSMVLASV